MIKTTRKRKATKASRKAGKTSAARFLQDNAGNALRHGQETLGRAYGWAHDAAESARLRNLRLPNRSDIAHLSEANPLLLGAVGLGLGVAIGTLFPRGMHRSSPAPQRAAASTGTTSIKRRSRRRNKKNGTAASA